MLARTRMARPSTVSGSSSAPRTRSAARSASTVVGACSSSTANSSPPRRAARSSSRSEPRRRSATVTSSASPAACPSVSLTLLKSSRSRNSTAGAVPSRVSAASTRSENSERFARPVSGSCRASCARRSLSSVTAASARAVCPLSRALPAWTPTVSSRRRSRGPNAWRARRRACRRRALPAQATTIAAGRPRPVSPMRRSGRVGEVDHRGVRELVEQRALGQGGLARERAARPLTAVDLRAQHSPVGGVQDERGAVGADERAGVLEQHSRRSLGAGRGVHVAHDREQRLDLGALPPSPARGRGRRARSLRPAGADEQDEERSADRGRARSSAGGRAPPRRARSPRWR